MISNSNIFTDTSAPICRLEASQHFNSLSPSEKHYAHHIAKASWLGARIILIQTTKFSEKLFDFLIALFKENSANNFEKLKNGISEESFNFFIEYAAQFLCNLGNYRSFGDSKFIPRISEGDFEKIVKSNGNDKVQALWSELKDEIYRVTPESVLSLGYPDEGNLIGYYSDDVTKEDIKLIQAYCEEKKFDPLNSRLWKVDDKSFEIRVASSEILEPVTDTYKGYTIKTTYGDFSAILTQIIAHLKLALPHVANDNQKQMLEHYIKHFQNGSIDEHKESQRKWILDIGPSVETNFGFVETYRDPAGIRAEFEGFVAVVNKEMTRKFENLVKAAPTFINKLPWGKSFEKDKFLKPDFTSLEVINFSTGGIPAGINIPNYDDIRQTFGFKNVSLGNVVNAKSANEKINFISQKDLPLYEKLRGPAFELQVGIHELLGHGTGKLLQQNADGTFNFSKESPPINPLTGEPITQWYKPGETYNGNLKEISSSYEECRAESVAMSLSTDLEVLSIFGFDSKNSEGVDPTDVTYICWLQMAKAGLSALEFYSPQQNKWGQAHMQARYAILQVFLRAGDDFLNINQHPQDGLIIELNKQKIFTTGLKAINDFLIKLQVYKSTGDGAGATKLYSDYTSVTGKWLEWREEVLRKKQPRKIWVQGNTFVESDNVVWKDYDVSLYGIINSFIEREI